MPISYDHGRALATLVEVAAVEPIPGADNIEIARVRGWQTVVGKGDFQPGDLAVYFEIDTALPVADPAFAFLKSRGVKTVDGEEFHALRTVRLRGAISQGLLVHIPDGLTGQFITRTAVGEDVTGWFGVGKWEPDLPDGKNLLPFPTQLARKSDSPRVQNLTEGEFAALNPIDWYPTEKIDGTSCTVWADDNDCLHVASRNWELVDEDSIYWAALHSYYEELTVGLGRNEAVQFEIAGPGVQENRLHLSERQVFVFAAFRYGDEMHLEEWSRDWNGVGAPILPLRLPGSIAEAVAQADGMTSSISRNLQAEGIVWHSRDPQTVTLKDGSTSFKVINNKYLLKQKG